MFSVNEIIKATSGLLIQGNPADEVNGVCTDTRKIKPTQAFLALKGENFDGHDFIKESLKLKATCLIVQKNPDFKIPEKIAVIKVKDTTLALGDLARFIRSNFNHPVIAITGSNGKTTTKEMIAWVLSAKAQVLKNEGTKNNQIGLPQTLIQLKSQDDYALVEIGTNHFGEVGYLAKIARPHIGLITNIGPSHLEFLNDLKGVLKEKTALLDNLVQPNIAILNADDKLLKPLIMLKNKQMSVFSYGINEKSDFSASAIRLRKGKVEFKVNFKYDFAISTLGDYNIYNALAAISVGRILGLSYAQIASRLRAFKFPRGRLNLIEFKGVSFIDDTYNSNPLSLKVALLALKKLQNKGKKVLVMGDMLELGGQKELLHKQAAGSITKACDFLLSVGNLAKITARQAIKSGFNRKNVFSCTDSSQARDLLFKKIPLKDTDVVLVKGSRSMRMEEIFKA